MGEEIPFSRFNKKDFTAFEAHLRVETELLGDWFAQRRFVEQPLTVGCELEAWLVDGNGMPMPINETFLKACADPLVVAELARFNVEFNCMPQHLQGGVLRAIETDLQQTWDKANTVASTLGGRLMMIGILPTVDDEDLTLENMSEMKRFRALNEQVLRLRKGHPIQLDITGHETLSMTHHDVMLESAATSLQLHLQVDIRDAARYFNAAMILSAPMVAVSANSPYLFGKDLWDETRITLFEQAICLGSNDAPHCKGLRRVDFGSSYIQQSLYELFVENVDCFPVLLPVTLDDTPEHLAHVHLHNGTIWRWNRPLIGFDNQGDPHIRIEHRVIPAGPTMVDCIANAALFYGLVVTLATQSTPPESFVNFNRARSNFYDAARSGLQARLTWMNGKAIGATELLQSLLPLARQGLDSLGIAQQDSDRYLGIIDARLHSGQNGASWQRAYVAKHHCDMHALATAYIKNQQSGVPVHEWPL